MKETTKIFMTVVGDIVENDKTIIVVALVEKLSSGLLGMAIGRGIGK